MGNHTVLKNLSRSRLGLAFVLIVSGIVQAKNMLKRRRCTKQVIVSRLSLETSQHKKSGKKNGDY